MGGAFEDHEASVGSPFEGGMVAGVHGEKESERRVANFAFEFGFFVMRSIAFEPSGEATDFVASDLSFPERSPLRK